MYPVTLRMVILVLCSFVLWAPNLTEREKGERGGWSEQVQPCLLCQPVCGHPVNTTFIPTWFKYPLGSRNTHAHTHTHVYTHTQTHCNRSIDPLILTLVCDYTDLGNTTDTMHTQSAEQSHETQLQWNPNNPATQKKRMRLDCRSTVYLSSVVRINSLCYTVVTIQLFNFAHKINFCLLYRIAGCPQFRG